MSPRRLLDPCPRETALEYTPAKLRVRGMQMLPIPELPIHRSFSSVIGCRTTSREFGPTSQAALSTLLWLCAKTHCSGLGRLGLPWEHRGAPSAGGCHPITIVVVGPVKSSWECAAYDPLSHALHDLALCPGISPHSLRGEVSRILPPMEGTILIFAADFAKTMCQYEAGESLVWRDAGALLASISLCAEALDLNSCALGFTGDTVLKHLEQGDKFLGVGGCILGSRPV